MGEVSHNNPSSFAGLCAQRFSALGDQQYSEGLALARSYWGKEYISAKKEGKKIVWSIATLGPCARLLRWLNLGYVDTRFETIRNAFREENCYPKEEDRSRGVYGTIKTKWRLKKGVNKDNLPPDSDKVVQIKLGKQIPFTNRGLYEVVFDEEVIEEFKSDFKENNIVDSKSAGVIWHKGIQPQERGYSLNPHFVDTQLEDNFKVKVRGKTSSCQLLAVFDGHGNDRDDQTGASVTSFFRDNIVKFLKSNLEQAQTLDDTAIFNALKKAWVQVKGELKKTKNIERRLSADINLIIGNDIWTAHIGNGCSYLVTRNDQESVKQLNRHVDLRYEPGIHDKPKIHKFTLEEGQTSQIVMATSAVWDAVSVDKLRNAVNNNEDNQAIAEELLFEAVKRNTGNITILVHSLEGK